MKTRYVVGVDGGQTATLAVVCDEAGRLVGAGVAGPSNHIHEPGGIERQRAALAGSVGQALAAAGLPARAVAAAGLGMTGGWEEARPIAETLLPAARVQSEWDVVTCLLGANAGRPGVVLIAGTGSVAFGINAQGARADAGGWGYFLGDQGSAYDLGRAALRAVVKAHDGRGPATALQHAVLAQVGASDLRAIHRRYYQGQLDRAQVAQLAATVSACAAAGDGVARDLLHAAAEELAAMAGAVIGRLWQSSDSVPVCPVGGLFRAGAILLDPLRTALAQAAPGARLAPARFSPAIGCVLMAFERLHIPLSEEVLNALDRAGDALRPLKP